MIRHALLTILFLASLGLAPAAVAQNLFSPRVIVNERAVTNFEVQQRFAMLTLFRAPGNLEDEAVKGLIDDRLRRGAAQALGLTVADDAVRAGMEEFASRANMSAEQFITELGRAGVAPETFRDFVEAGLLWREVIRARFLPRAQITEAEIDRALAGLGQTAAVRVLLSEIIIPAPPGGEAQALALAQRLQREIRSEGAFAAAARRYSASETAGRGGRLDWLPLANLPPALAPLVLGLAPGEVSDPLPFAGAVALFQLRALEETRGAEPASTAVEYAQFFLPEGPNAAAEVARIRARVDTCNDLYGVAKGLPEERLVFTTQTMREVPQDIGLELARLDPGESSGALVRGGARVFLMLCSRTPELAEPPSRDEVREELLNRRLSAYAEGYLEELRSDAMIRTP